MTWKLAGAALLGMLPASFGVCIAQETKTLRSELGAMAVGVLTHASPAVSGRALTEGYLTQPMLMGAVGLGGLRFTGTLNAEGYTLKRGELNAGMYGEGYVDRRHPHTLVHEAMVSATTPVLGGGWRASLAAGRGFTPYGTDDPMVRPFVKYPVNHHHAQIIERVQALGALQWSRGMRQVTLEHGWFNGDEPTSPFNAPQWSRFGDSRATRLTVVPHDGWEWQGSHAFVRSPGITQGGTFDHRQWSTSLRHARTPGGTTTGPQWLGGLAEYARTDEGLGRQSVFRFESVLAEGTVGWHGWLWSTRIERTERPENERLLDLFRTNAGHIDFQIIGVTRWSVLSTRIAAPTVTLAKSMWQPFVEIGRAHAAARREPAVFQPSVFYGNATQWSVTLGTRWHVGSMRSRMGRYGVLDAAHGLGASAAHGHHQTKSTPELQ
ncbi:MAG: hypothetical protein IBJ03_07155 [Gemmatimonadaceae bacterium]|nr:hypothetical protein [Gemmatimonadaceae bacterium]